MVYKPYGPCNFGFGSHEMEMHITWLLGGSYRMRGAVALRRESAGSTQQIVLILHQK